MKGKKYTAEQIVAKLAEAEVLLASGTAPAEVCRQLEITEVTYYRWRKEYGGLRADQAKRLKELEQENTCPRSFPMRHNLLTCVNTTCLDSSFRRSD